eukprot:scaffold12194_cov129-Cylindrotheca_fusiformis.AAC.20
MSSGGDVNGKTSDMTAEGTSSVDPPSRGSSNSSNDSNILFCYTRASMEVPDDATHVRVSAAVVPRFAFHQHQRVKNIEFLPGVTVIGSMATAQCEVLTKIQVPPSVSAIGGGAFGCNAFLTHVDLPETLQFIPEGSFSFCVSFCSFRVPSGVLSLGHRAFWGCKRLLSIEIPHGLVQIGGECFLECVELRNIVLPTEMSEVGPGAFNHCKALRKEGEHDEEIVAHLKTRYSELPLHNICYYHTYDSSTSDIVGSVDAIIDEGSTDTAVSDKFEMSPLHVLALSARPSLALCSRIFCKQKDLLQRTDCWGMTPFLYAANNVSPTTLQVVKHISQAHYSKQVESLGLERWKTDVYQTLNQIHPDDQFTERGSKIRMFLKKIAVYYKKEVLSIVELAVWKAYMVEESRGVELDEHSPSRKEAKSNFFTGISTDMAVDRVECRTLCKANIVIDCILPFLSKHLIDAAPYLNNTIN